MAQQEDASLQKLLKHIPYSTVDFLSILMQGVIPFKFDLIDITDCLLGKNVGGVKSLLKVALLSLIEKAMNKQEKRIVLRELVVNCYEPNGFGPLIFSDSSPIRKFIVRFMSPESRVQMIEIMETETRFILNGSDFYCEHQNGEVPFTQILDLIPVVLTRNVQSASIWIAEALPHSEQMFTKITEVSDICLSHLYTSSSLTDGHYRRSYRTTLSYF